MAFLAHAMEYQGGPLSSELSLRCYEDSDYPRYRRVYESCFHEMRAALGRFPVDCCADRGELLRKRNQIFILEDEGELAGSVAIFGNEVDDLIVAEQFQKKGYGTALLCFAVSRLQRACVSPIVLHVADWNQNALRLYLQNGFQIVHTEEVE